MDSAMKTQMAPPLSLLVVGALTPPHHEVELADENVERPAFDDRPDLVGITVKVDTADRSWDIARRYRARGVPVVVGGVHAAACPDACLAHADAVVIGEAEGLWEKVLADASAGRLRRVYRHDRPPDLSRTPVPRWELLAGKNYLMTNTLTVSRGCPWRCEFCYNSVPGIASRFRAKPIRNILREIESLGARHVMFIDDNLIGDRRFARDLLRALRPLGITWHAAVSADVGRDAALLDLMCESGGQSLFIGFETVNERNIRACGKRQNKVSEYDRTIARIHERGMMVNASIVLGFDHDEPDVFDRTCRWLVSRRVETMTAHILTPYPGTALHRRLQAAGRIVDRDLRHYTTSRVVFEPAGMSAEELEAGYRRLYDEFYSWANILRRVPVHPRQRRAFLVFNLLYRKYGRYLAPLGRVRLMNALGRAAYRLSYGGVRRQVRRAVPPGALAGGQARGPVAARSAWGEPAYRAWP